jgi:hypothetical protein
MFKKKQVRKLYCQNCVDKDPKLYAAQRAALGMKATSKTQAKYAKDAGAGAEKSNAEQAAASRHAGGGENPPPAGCCIVM